MTTTTQPLTDPPRAATPTEAEFRTWLHPNETSRAPWAYVGVGFIALLGLALLIVTFGALLIFVGIALAGVWFTGRIAEARLRGNAIEVNEYHFPEIARRLEELRTALAYPKDVRAFVVQDGEINAFLWRVFGRRYLRFNSGLVESMTDQERDFVIGRFIGTLRARHLRFHEAASIIGGLERLWVVNLLVLPYLRATVLSGDRIGLRLCGDADAARTALDKLFLGQKLAGRIVVDGVLEQGRTLDRSAFKGLSLVFSDHPHLTDRYRELVAYTREIAPDPAVFDPPSAT